MFPDIDSRMSSGEMRGPYDIAPYFAEGIQHAELLSLLSSVLWLHAGR